MIFKMIFNWIIIFIFMLSLDASLVCMQDNKKEDTATNDIVHLLSSSEESCKSYLRSLQTYDANEETKKKFGKFGLLMARSQNTLFEKQINEQLLHNYRNAFVSFVQDEVDKKAEGDLYGSTKELYTFIKVYDTIQLGYANKKSIEFWLDQQTFVKKILPLLIIASRNPYLFKQAPLYDNSALFASTANPSLVNALIYGSDEFTSLQYLNKYNGLTFSNVKENIFNMFRQKNNKKTLKVGSVIKDIIKHIKNSDDEGYLINNSFYLLNKENVQDIYDDIITLVEQTPETGITYLKTCFKPRRDIYSFNAMSDTFKKKFITFLMCIKLKDSQNYSFKVPKMVIKNVIFPKIASYGRAHYLQPLFKTDIEQCKVVTALEEENPALKKVFDFLYNDFDAWFKQEMDKL